MRGTRWLRWGEQTELFRLSESEVRDLVRLLGLHRALGELERMSEAERVGEFMKYAERQLLVALYMATSGLPFEQIITDEYRRINPPRAQELYRGVALLHRFKVSVRATLIHRVYNISYVDFREQFYTPLKGIILDSPDEKLGIGASYRTRHPEIARILISQIYPNPGGFDSRDDPNPREIQPDV